MDAARAAEELRAQAEVSRGRSPLYERLFAGLAGAVERGFDGGVVPRLLSVPGPSSPVEARLLLIAALHDAALRDPSLPHAAWFPTAVPAARPADEGAPAALALAHLIEHEDEVAAFIASQRVQTNEVGRCAALLPGVLAAADLGLPLRLLEVGCSAGLNLRLDRYRYHYLGGPSWGPGAGLLLEAKAEGRVPDALVPPTVEVVERLGVDLRPLDPTDPDDARLLAAFVWPDDHDRHQRLREAVAVAAATDATVEAGDLVGWTAERVRPVPGATTVVFHSLVEYMLGDTRRASFERGVAAAVAAGRADAPVVHVRFEAPGGRTDDLPDLTVAIGDGGRDPAPVKVLHGDWHGRWVRWV